MHIVWNSSSEADNLGKKQMVLLTYDETGALGKNKIKILWNGFRGKFSAPHRAGRETSSDIPKRNRNKMHHVA